MAGMVTHIVLTDQVYDEQFGKFDRKSFVVGTSFADIRYLGVIERDKTHYSDASIERIRSQEDSFIAGLMFHSLVDKIREDYIKSKYIYRELPKSDYISQAMKVCEDIVVYPKCKHWDQYANYFGTILENGRDYGIDATEIERWHNIIRTAIGKQPDLVITSDILQQLQLDSSVVDEIMSLAKQLLANHDTNYILDFYRQFPACLK